MICSRSKTSEEALPTSLPNLLDIKRGCFEKLGGLPQKFLVIRKQKYSSVALLTPFDTHEYFIRIAENGHKCIIFRATSGLTSDGLLMVFSELFGQHFFLGGKANF